jgi:hypothetical protein
MYAGLKKKNFRVAGMYAAMENKNPKRNCGVDVEHYGMWSFMSSHSSYSRAVAHAHLH